ncbi:MAG: cyclic nucleotide-binding domain-containing protein, partial [Pseudomonadota bacterium]
MLLGLDTIMDFRFDSTFRVNGSYAYGFAFFFAMFSLMITFKTLVKAAFLLMATNNAFELKLRFSPLFIGLTISNESSNTIKEASVRTMYFLGVISTHLWSVSLMSEIFTSENMKINAILAGLLLWGYDMNPIGWGELKDWLNSLRTSDPKNPWYLLQYKPHKVVKLDSKMGQRFRWLFDSYMIVWGLVSLMFLLKLLTINLPYIEYVFTSDSAQQKLAAFTIFACLLFGNVALIYLSLVAIKNRYWEQAQEAYGSLVARIQNKKAPRLDHQQTHEELLKLPVLNWFSEDELHELLKKSRFLSLQKGQVAFEPGSPAEHLMVLLTGRLQVQSVITEANQRIKKWPLLPVSIFGEEA